MKKKELKLEKKEMLIISMIQNDDNVAIEAFKMMLYRYYVDDLENMKNYYSLIKAVYIDKDKSAKWSVSGKCYIGDRTAFRYRNKFIKTFYKCYESVIFINEVVATVYDI